MEVTYKREMKHNYLIIKPDENSNTGYESRMLMGNTIEGLLRFRVKQMDSSRYYYYEITSKQPLSRVLENRCISLSEIQQLLLGITLTLNHMENYLLKEEQILLEPDYIYIEPENFEVSLCLIPGRNADFPEDLTKLLQYILGKVNHQEKESVVLAYGLYQESLKDNYGIEDLLKLLRQESTVEVVDEVELNEEKQEPAEEWQEISRPYTDRKPVNWKVGSLIISGMPIGIWFLKGLDGLIRYWPILVVIDIITVIITVMPARFRGVKEEGNGDKEMQGDMKNDWRMQFEEEEMIPVPQKENTKESIKADEKGVNTVLLVDLDERENSRKLVSLEDGGTDIVISYFPFIIGKQEGLVDYVLSRDTVSRLHLRIDKELDCYRITDLNSTNGTAVNGHILETNDTAALNSGDEVSIANMKFLFR